MSLVLSKLPKQQHIKSGNYFSQLIRKGKKFHGRYFTCYFLPKRQGNLKLGVACSKQAPNAVWRNFYKRRMRLAFQANMQAFSTAISANCDVVLLAKHLEQKLPAKEYISDFADSLQKYTDRDKIRR